jgi:hypothetical protein
VIDDDESNTVGLRDAEAQGPSHYPTSHLLSDSYQIIYADNAAQHHHVNISSCDINPFH